MTSSPSVGSHFLLRAGSDRYGFTVVECLKEKVVIIKSDSFNRTIGLINGKWREVVQSANGRYVLADKRQSASVYEFTGDVLVPTYLDPSF
jgi:hypothetical protein